MICLLSEDVIIYIFKKLHRFKYLKNLLFVNHYLYKQSYYVYLFHFNKLHQYLNTSNLEHMYVTISNNLFNSKILNIKKIYNNNIKDLPFTNLIKLLIIFNEYHLYNIDSKYIKIISYNQLLEPINIYQSDLHYFPFLIFNLNSKFFIFVEYYKSNLYRLKIKSIVSNTNVGYYKEINETDVIKMLNITRGDLLKIYL